MILFQRITPQKFEGNTKIRKGTFQEYNFIDKTNCDLPVQHSKNIDLGTENVTAPLSALYTNLTFTISQRAGPPLPSSTKQTLPQRYQYLWIHNQRPTHGKTCKIGGQCPTGPA
jgi:hypothetical protein